MPPIDSIAMVATRRINQRLEFSLPGLQRSGLILMQVDRDVEHRAGCTALKIPGCIIGGDVLARSGILRSQAFSHKPKSEGVASEWVIHGVFVLFEALLLDSGIKDCLIAIPVVG